MNIQILLGSRHGHTTMKP